jgi:hypothetical protein
MIAPRKGTAVTRRRRHYLAGILVLLLALTTGAVGVKLAGESESRSEAEAEAEAEGHGEGGELPRGLEGRIEKLREATPGNGGMGPEGPSSAADAEFAQRAYPADTIKVAQMDTAKSAVGRAKDRPVPLGKTTKGSWTNVGPSQALYPDTRFRDAFSYVPNDYVAGGRTTSITIGDSCRPGNCRVWATPSGGGIWRTDDALAGQPRWKYLGGPLGINAAGAVAVDHNDRSGKTVYVGTGEANICGSGCVAGVGLYKSTNGGDTWTGPLGKKELGAKGIGDIIIKPGNPKVLYVGTTSALRGMSSACCTPVPARRIPDAAQWGLYKSTDGGKTWKFIHNGSVNAADCTGDQTEFTNGGICSPRGVRHVELDPSNPEIVYASSYARGIWRSPDGGKTWTMIKQSLNSAVLQTRAAFDVTRLPNGKTRMYVSEGNNGTDVPQVYRSDDVAAGTPAFTTLSSDNPASPGFAWFNLCTGQCWYDDFVLTPDGHPDVFYAGGSYGYDENIANHRAVILSTDAGASGTDMTFDGTDQLHPNGLHPDQHDIAVNPNNPFQFFETNDGGIMRSSGSFVNRSSWCDDPRRELEDAELTRCRQMLSRIPSRLQGLNDGFNTLQFMSLSVSPFDSRELQGGTQDNGTWENYGRERTWLNTIIGDGGWSGFDVGRREFRFHNYFDASTEVNFNNGNTADWIATYAPIMGQTGTLFYTPVINDPKVSGTMFAGTGLTAYRTKTFGLGTRTVQQAVQDCSAWLAEIPDNCGDWAKLGPNDLTSAFWGDREGPAVAAVDRTTADTSTAWSATSTGRVFITKNVDAADPASVAWTRIDDDATTPNRFVTSIHVDPANANHAWISYSGFNSNTPNATGHVFEVTFNPSAGTATWANRSHDLSDIPITDLVRDDTTGDLYASNDFGVLRLAAGSTTWTNAAPGMPNVEVAGLTILPKERILYAASHGLSAWRLDLKK